MGTAPGVGKRARRAAAFVRAAGDSKRHDVVDEEFELPVMARALGIAPFVVVAADLSEVLSVEDDGEVMEDLGQVGGGLVAEFRGERRGQTGFIAAIPRRRARGARR